MPKAKIVTDLKNNYFTNNKITFGTAQPTSGTYTAGDIVINKAPNSNAYGWICTASGSPGSWKILKSASDISLSWGNVSGKPSTFPPTIGTTSTTAFRGDQGQIAYNHSQSAHAPSNAQKNSNITKAEIEAKLTGNITSHSHNYAAVSHGNHVPNKETANNTKFLRNDGSWATMFPNFISGIANFSLPDHLSGAPIAYVKLCSVKLTSEGRAHCELLLSGNGDHGQTGHSFGILRVSGRGSGYVNYLELMRSDTTQVEFGYVKSGTNMDVWMKRPAFDGIGAMTVLGVSAHDCAIFKNPQISANAPSGYKSVKNTDLYQTMKTKICLGNANVFRGTTTNLGQVNMIGVDSRNNIFLGLDNQAYINVNNTMKVFKDITISSDNAAALYTPTIKIGDENSGVIHFGPTETRFEYSVGQKCVQIAGAENQLYGYHIPFRAKTIENVVPYCKIGSYWFAMGPNSDPSGKASVWFRN